MKRAKIIVECSVADEITERDLKELIEALDDESQFRVRDVIVILETF